MMNIPVWSTYVSQLSDMGTYNPVSALEWYSRLKLVAFPSIHRYYCGVTWSSEELEVRTKIKRHINIHHLKLGNFNLPNPTADVIQNAGSKRRWLKSFIHRNRENPSEGQASGASSIVPSTASGSIISLPSSSSRNDCNTLTPTDTHSIHAGIISGAAPVIPEQLLRSEQERTTAPDRARTNAQGSGGSQSSTHAVIRGEHKGKSPPANIRFN